MTRCWQNPARVTAPSHPPSGTGFPSVPGLYRPSSGPRSRARLASMACDPAPWIGSTSPSFRTRAAPRRGFFSVPYPRPAQTFPGAPGKPASRKIDTSSRRAARTPACQLPNLTVLKKLKHASCPADAAGMSFAPFTSVCLRRRLRPAGAPMRFWWTAAVALWTFLAGPVFAPRPAPATHPPAVPAPSDREAEVGQVSPPGR